MNFLLSFQGAVTPALKDVLLLLLILAAYGIAGYLDHNNTSQHAEFMGPKSPEIAVCAPDSPAPATDASNDNPLARNERMRAVILSDTRRVSCP